MLAVVRVVVSNLKVGLELIKKCGFMDFGSGIANFCGVLMLKVETICCCNLLNEICSLQVLLLCSVKFFVLCLVL
jgi:hypothetical protein